MKRQKKDYEELIKEDNKMCKTERLHIRFTNWEAFKRTVQKVLKYEDKQIHGEVVIELK